MGYLALILLGFSAFSNQLWCFGFESEEPPPLASRTCSADDFMMPNIVPVNSG